MVENQKFKGFTLLELIVAMAIIAVLIGLSLLGIQTVQRSSRDTGRRTTLQAINLEVTDYYGGHNNYPTVGSFGGVVSATSLNMTAALAEIGLKTIALSGAATAASGVTPATVTAASSGYCYTAPAPRTTYSLGVTLESGVWFNLGTAAACSVAM